MRFSGFDDEWKKSNLGNISSNEMYGMNSAAKDYDGFNKYIRITDISETSNKFIPNPLTSPDGDLEDKYKLKKGDIVFARTGASTGKTYLYDDNDRNLYFAGFLIKFHIDNADPKFIFYNTLKEEYLNWVSVMSVRSGQPGINSNEYKKLPIILPSLDEQNKISNFLTSIDKKIDLLERKHQFYQEFKKFLMQQIFTQKLRFKNDKQWNVYLLRNFINEYNERMGNKSNLPILSSTLNGIFLQNEYFNKSVSSKDVKNYKIVPNGYFTYRSMSDTDKFRFNIQSIVEVGIISPAYPVFSTQNIDDYFLYYYLNNSNFIKKQILSLKEGGTRYALSFSKFKKLKISLPSLEEQEKIANFLSAVDKKIDLIQTQIQKMEEFKKGLLQQMFVVRINWRCNFKLAKSPSFNKHLLILKNKIIFIIIK